MSVTVYIGFGSNMGDREAIFRASLESITKVPGTEVTAHSKLYETEPVGLVDGGREFLNGAIALETTLPPADLMTFLRSIEQRLGKSPTHRSNESRPIDLDMLLYGDGIIQEDGLTVPHPRMHTRGFVLAPLAEIAPDAVHPVLNRTVSVLLSRLADEELRSVRKRDRLPA
ncbi:MAG: 2-amino-4-hydroxy-6-hydroxymethyldihydropteridine diphosphokinase [Desulfomonilaceae bacterium]|nr:2-amino-4-hydroxy-6-hydroxymethyldihydropteridine diphosphokinase [Desulfomonilaceae bacterium]